MLRITPLIRERIKLLRDVLTAADFFFVDQLAPYDPAELIPQKGDAAMAESVEKAQVVLPKSSSSTTRWTRRYGRPLRNWGEGRPDVSADSRGRLRTQERAAAVRDVGSVGARETWRALSRGFRS